MALLNHRILYSDNGTITDLTDRLNNFLSESESLTLTVNEDALYVGSLLPFNHRWFEIATANTSAASVNVELWDGSNFEPAVDILDQTRSTDRTTTMDKSGHISWVLDKNESWAREDTDKMTGSELVNLKIYDLYWAKITFSATVSFNLKYVGFKFSDDSDLGSMYPDLASQSIRDQFNRGVAGKTSWDDQHFRVAEIVIRDLKKDSRVVSENQILRWDLFTLPAIHKLAELIFRAMGGEMAGDRMEMARKDYQDAINLETYQADKNSNTRLDFNETLPVTSMKRR